MGARAKAKAEAHSTGAWGAQDTKARDGARAKAARTALMMCGDEF